MSDWHRGPSRPRLSHVCLLGARRRECGGRWAHSGADVRRLTNIGRLFTGTPAGVVERAAVIVDDERIAWCGREGDEPLELMGYVSEDENCNGGLMTAGLIDAHTHPVYAGDRMAEVAMRTAGASYSEVAKAGGGIRATVTATRAESTSELEQGTARR